MTKHQAGILNLAISITIATVMIISAKFLPDESNSVRMGLLVAIWFVPFWILTNWTNSGGLVAELRCFRKRPSE